MSNPLPSSLSLTNIPSGSQILSSTHDTNYSAVQTAFNQLLTALAAGTSGQVLTSAGPTALSFVTSPTAPYRKVTAKAVNTSVAEADLLNGEITVAANAIGANGMLRLTARGDWLQNTGVAADVPRFKLKLGATTLLDIGPSGANVAGTGAARNPWSIDIRIQNLGATNSQWASLSGLLVHANSGTAAATAPTVGEGGINTLQATNTPAYLRTSLEAAATGAVDTTVAQALSLTVINAVSNANYETKLYHALVEIL